MVLVEAISPEAARELQKHISHEALVDFLRSKASDMHLIVERVGAVDKTRQGLFLFNYFVDIEV